MYVLVALSEYINATKEMRDFQDRIQRWFFDTPKAIQYAPSEEWSRPLRTEEYSTKGGLGLNFFHQPLWILLRCWEEQFSITNTPAVLNSKENSNECKQASADENVFVSITVALRVNTAVGFWFCRLYSCFLHRHWPSRQTLIDFDYIRFDSIHSIPSVNSSSIS